MKFRWLPRSLSVITVGLLLTLAPDRVQPLAGEGGITPPCPVAPLYPGDWSDELGIGLYALTLIY